MQTTSVQISKINLLKNIDWDFADSLTNSATNSIHPYPAKFIPQIPYHFIQQLSAKGDTVYEPFLGSGTTAVEANILGRNAIGNDVNELAVLISKVKTTGIAEKKLSSLDSLLIKIYNHVDLLNSGHKNGIVKPDIIRLDLWFEDFVINELVVIKDEINKLDNKDLIDLCLVALSGIIINVSRQDSDTRYVRVPKTIKPFDTFNKFAKQINKLRKIMNESSKLIENGSSVFKVADTREENIFVEDSADLAVTA